MEDLHRSILKCLILLEQEELVSCNLKIIQFWWEIIKMLWFVEKRVPERGLWERKGSEKDRYGIVIISTKRWPSEFLTYMLIITLMYSCLWFERCSVEKDEKRRGFFKKKELHHIHISLSNKEASLYHKSHMNHFHYPFQFMTRLLKFFDLQHFIIINPQRRWERSYFHFLLFSSSNHSLKILIRRLKIDRSGNKISSTRLITRFPFICLSPPTERVLDI